MVDSRGVVDPEIRDWDADDVRLATYHRVVEIAADLRLNEQNVEDVLADAGEDLSAPEVQQGIADGIEMIVEKEAAANRVAYEGGGGSEELALADAYYAARGVRSPITRSPECARGRSRATRSGTQRRRGSRRCSRASSSSDDPDLPADIARRRPTERAGR